MQHYRTGDGVIFKVPEREIPIPAADLYPDAMRSAGADEASKSISPSIHSWVVRTPVRRPRAGGKIPPLDGGE